MTQFGLQIMSFNFEPSDMFERTAEVAQAAERTGFDSVWVMDHLFQLPALGGPEFPMLESYTILGAIGARTERVKLGALVGGVTYRNPSLVAKCATTLDIVTRGRAICGLGAAWFEVEHIGLGFDFPPAGERISRLEEAVQICRAMFTEETPTFDGKYYRIKEARNVPRPIRPGGIPIMIGGGGERRTLRVVARYADMCNLFGDAAILRHKFDVLRRHCEEVGRSYDDITRSRLATLMITDTEADGAKLREQFGPMRAGGFTIGTEKEILLQIEELEEAGVQYFIFNLVQYTPEAVQRAGELLNGR
jgi:F420-dependent oxidoreductase-like protein